MKKYLYIMLLYVSTYTYADTYTDYDRLTNNSGGGNIVATMIDDNPYDWQITATPIGGYKFGYWNDFYGTIESFENPIRFTIDRENRNYGLQAVFVKDDAFIGGWLADSIIVRSLSTPISDSDLGQAILYVDEGELEENIATPVRFDHGIWRFYANDLFEDNKNAGKNLHIVLLNECDEPTSVINTVVPYIINTSCNADAISFATAMDVEVLSDGVLNINANTVIAGNLNIHAGGKVVVPAGKTLTVNGIIMHGNGITKKWAQLDVDVAGKIVNNNNDTIYYDYTLDQHAYYPLSLPYDVMCEDVYNPINGDAASYQSYEYQTDKRTSGTYAWVEYNDLIEEKFEAGKGYIVYAVPTKWNNSKATRQSEAIIRFPMVADLSSAGEGNMLVTTVTDEEATDEVNANWNLIGNPYLKDITLGHTTPGKIGAFQGTWENDHFVEAEYGTRSLRYITYSTDGYRSYEQEEVSNFVMKPFNCYLTQTAHGNRIQFTPIIESTPAPERRAADSSNEPEEIATGVILSQGSNTDHVGLLFGDFTEAYELNADLAKEFGEAQPMSAYSLLASTPMAYIALPMEGINRPVPVGYRKAEMSEMTFSFDDGRYDRNLLEALWLTDQVTGKVTDLLFEDYTFMPEATQDDNRFFLSLEKRKVVDVTTAVDEVNQERTITHIYDMLGREVNTSYNMLPQGVYVITDNLGTTRKEIIR